MTWSERLKSAWITFKREALPLYGWTFIFIAVTVVLVIALAMGFIEQLRWTFPNIHNFGGAYSYSRGMPVPGIPPTPNMPPFAGPFGLPSQDLFSYFGGMKNFSNLLSVFGSLAGTLFLILLVGWLVGSAFYTGIFNLTAKAYREKVSFKDFRLTGFFRILGWQAFLFLIQLILLTIGLMGAFALRHSGGFLLAFFIVYAFFMLAIGLYTLPWLTSSAIYLLVHREVGFLNALSGSWRFFRRYMGALWGYIGAVILIEIAVELLTRISSGLAGLATLAVSPFVAVLAIVWVLTLEDDERNRDSDSPVIGGASSLSPIEPKINLQKTEPLPPFTENKPPFCPSCGKSNTGTAYCPQCGTKL